LISSEAQTLHTFFETERYFGKHYKILLGYLYMSSSEQPKIVAFLCNWCAYAGADLAGVSRMQYPTNVRLIRLMCTGRVNHGFLLKAFLNGADGVLVSG
jgi:F420-non-reducing hydrogenase iron-sulfur subunit